MRECSLDVLRMIRATANVATYRYSDDGRTSVVARASVMEHRHFVSDLIRSRPDVVTELDLGDRFQPAGG